MTGRVDSHNTSIKRYKVSLETVRKLIWAHALFLGHTYNSMSLEICWAFQIKTYTSGKPPPQTSLT